MYVFLFRTIRQHLSLKLNNKKGRYLNLAKLNIFIHIFSWQVFLNLATKDLAVLFEVKIGQLLRIIINITVLFLLSVRDVRSQRLLRYLPFLSLSCYLMWFCIGY